MTLKEVGCLIGPPCAGKGTQGYLLNQKGFLCLSAGTLLRRVLSVGNIERTKLDNGEIIAPQYVNNLLKTYVEQHEKIIFDGYPRDYLQAKFVVQNFKLKYVLLLELSENDIIKRALARYICTICEKTFDKKEYCCNLETSKRNDDLQLEIIEKRIRVYNENIRDILFILSGPVWHLDASLSRDQIHQQILKIIM